MGQDNRLGMCCYLYIYYGGVAIMNRACFQMMNMLLHTQVEAMFTKTWANKVH
jgi:hypothetical protein